MCKMSGKKVAYGKKTIFTRFVFMKDFGHISFIVMDSASDANAIKPLPACLAPGQIVKNSHNSS